MGTLESEFEEFKAIHKIAILKAKIIMYYKHLEVNQVNVPDFMRKFETPEAKADYMIKRLVMRDMREFNRLYEIAYKEIAEVLD